MKRFCGLTTALLLGALALNAWSQPPAKDDPQPAPSKDPPPQKQPEPPPPKEKDGKAKDAADKAKALLLEGEKHLEMARNTEAEETFRKALELLRKLVEDDPVNPAFRTELARGAMLLGEVQLRMARHEEALQSFRNALEILQTLFVEHPDDETLQKELARASMLLGEVQLQTDQLEEALKSSLRAVQLLERLRQKDPGNVAFLRDLARASRLRAAVLRGAGNLDEAKVMERQFEQVQKIIEALEIPQFSQRIKWELSLLPGKGPAMREVAYSSNGKYLAAAGRRLQPGKTPDGVIVWDATTGKELMSLKGYGSVAFRPLGQNLAGITESEEVQVWDALTGKDIRSLKAPGGEIDAVLYSPDGRFLSAASRVGDDKHGEVRIWNASNWEDVRTLKHRNAVGRLAYSADGMYLAGECDGGTVQLWRAIDWTEWRSFPGRMGTFSPDGTLLAIIGENNTNEVWDVASGEKVLTLRGANSKSMAISPDSKHVACAGVGGVKVWDAATGQPLALLTVNELKPGDSVSNLAFSPDGQRLAGVVDSDNTVKVWCLPVDASPGKPAPGHPEAPSGLDALIALKMSVKLLPADLRYDVDSDGGVTSRDALIIAQRRLAELAKKQP